MTAYEIGRANWTSSRRRAGEFLRLAGLDVTEVAVSDFRRGQADARADDERRRADSHAARLAPHLATAREILAAEEATEEEIEALAESLLAEADDEESEAAAAELAEEEARQRDAEAVRRATDPEMIAEAIRFDAELAAAELAETTDRRQRTLARAAIQAAEAHDLLIAAGWVPEHRSASSTYYTRGDERLRVSDHEVPMTGERQHDAENGGFTWAAHGRQIILPVADLAEEIGVL